MPCQDDISNPGTVSRDGRDVGHRPIASLLHHRQNLDLAGGEMRHGGGEAQERDLDVAAEQIIDRGASAAIGTWTMSMPVF